MPHAHFYVHEASYFLKSKTGMKKSLLILLHLALFTSLSAQKSNGFKLQAIIGTKLHTGPYEAPAIRQAWPLKSSFLVGFDIAYKRWPAFSLTYLNDRTYTFYNPTRTYPLEYYQSSLYSTLHGNYLGICYQRKNLKYGLGHYWSLFETSVNTTFSSIDYTNRDIALSFAIKAGRMEFEVVKLFRYFWVPGVTRADLQYINMKYRPFRKKHPEGQEKNKRNSIINPVFKIGARGFVVKNTHIPGEGKDILGASFLAGVDFRYKKTPLSFFAERDWWVRFNGGSPYRELKGYVVNSVLGVKYRLPKMRNAFVTVGYDWTTDHNTIYQTWEKIAKGEEKIDLYIYNVKGIAVGVGIPVFKRFDLDLRSILPFRGENIGNPMRYSIGIAYKINP
jgi:hypothetical protein